MSEAMRAAVKGPIPSILGEYHMEVGALVIRHGNKWYVYTDKWSPARGWTIKQYKRRFQCEPPFNLAQDWWGIVPSLCELGTCKDQNWCEEELQAALDMFAEEHTVKAKAVIRSRPGAHSTWEKMIFRAPVGR